MIQGNFLNIVNPIEQILPGNKMKNNIRIKMIE